MSGSKKSSVYDLIDKMETPLANARDLSLALVMAKTGADGAGFSREECDAALATLSRAVQAEVQRSHEAWSKLHRAAAGRT